MMMLLGAAQALRDNEATPLAVRDAGVYRVRGGAVAIDDSVEWMEGARDSVTVPPE